MDILSRNMFIAKARIPTPFTPTLTYIFISHDLNVKLDFTPPHPTSHRPLTHIQNIEAGPVAVLRLRDVLPLGFHGVWTDRVYPSASAFVSGGPKPMSKL